jgi:hypothetical protein
MLIVVMINESVEESIEIIDPNKKILQINSRFDCLEMMIVPIVINRILTAAEINAAVFHLRLTPCLNVTKKK